MKKKVSEEEKLARKYAGVGISNKLFDRAFWLPDDLEPIWAWVNALEAIDQRGDKAPLIALLKSDFKMPIDARWYLADLLDRYQLKRKRGAQAVPAYDFSRADVKFEMAKHAMTFSQMSLEKAAANAGFDDDDLEQFRVYLAGKRGSSIRANKRRPRKKKTAPFGAGS